MRPQMDYNPLVEWVCKWVCVIILALGIPVLFVLYTGGW